MEVTKSTWNGFERLDFQFEGRNAILVLPKEENRCDKWLLKTVYWDAFPQFEIDMVSRGWHLAFINNVSRWGKEDDIDRMARFTKFISSEFGLCDKCVPVGMSCGGLMAVKFGALYPKCVSCMFIDAPTLNLLSCPANLGVSQTPVADFEECMRDHGMTISELICYREHPIDKAPLMAKNNIPVIMVYGDKDMIVPYAENGAVLERIYTEAGAPIETICVKGRDHHPHGLKDNTPIIKFILKYSS